MKWLKKRWSVILIVLAITSVIGWGEKRCQTQAYQCRANYTAQLSPRLTVDQEASAQQEIAAACEPNGYFCRLFGAANLPSMLLVFVGALGIFAAIRTLSEMRGQTTLANKNIEMIISKDRARLRIDSVQVRLVDSAARRAGPPRDAEQIEFRVFCCGATDAFLVDAYVETWLSDRDGTKLTSPSKIPLAFLPRVIRSSGDGIRESEVIDHLTEFMVTNTPIDTKRTFVLHFVVRIRYTDAFQTTKHWQMEMKRSWPMTYHAANEAFFSWETPGEQQDTEQEKAN